MRVLVLGSSVWVIGCAWPLMDGARDPRALEYGLSVASLLALGGGAVLSTRQPANSETGSWLQSLCWLLLFPALLVAACAARPEYWNQAHYGAFGLFALWLSLCGYGAMAASISAEPATQLDAQLRAIDGEPPATPTSSRQWAQRIWIGLCLAGAMALTLVAPIHGGYGALEREWGDAAASGGVLVAVVGGALGVTTVAVFLSQGLRDMRPVAPASRAQIARRTLLFLLLAGLGATTYVAIRS